MGGPLGEAGINRAKKTPEELAAEAAAADQDEFTSEYSFDRFISMIVFFPHYIWWDFDHQFWRLQLWLTFSIPCHTAVS